MCGGERGRTISSIPLDLIEFFLKLSDGSDLPFPCCIVSREGIGVVDDPKNIRFDVLLDDACLFGFIGKFSLSELFFKSSQVFLDPEMILDEVLDLFSCLGLEMRVTEPGI